MSELIATKRIIANRLELGQRRGHSRAYLIADKIQAAIQDFLVAQERDGRGPFPLGPIVITPQDGATPDDKPYLVEFHRG